MMAFIPAVAQWKKLKAEFHSMASFFVHLIITILAWSQQSSTMFSLSPSLCLLGSIATIILEPVSYTL